MAVCIPLTLICDVTQDLLCVLNDATLPSTQPHLHNFLLLYLIMAHFCFHRGHHCLAAISLDYISAIYLFVNKPLSNY